MTVDFATAFDAVAEGKPLVNSITNAVTVNDVANITLHWGGLPVMSDNRRDAVEMVAGAQALLLNMGDVSERGAETMVATGQSANDHDVPVVVDPVGVGATTARDDVAERLVTEIEPTVIKGNYGEITALAGETADVRGVESVGEYSDIAASATACARETGAVVVASGETDIVATEEEAYEVDVGHPMMGEVVGTGCMLGVTVAVFVGALEEPLDGALAGTAAFGMAGERAAAGAYGEYEGPASYKVAFLDAAAGVDAEELDALEDRVHQLR